MNDGTPLSSSNYEIASMVKKNLKKNIWKKMIMYCYFFKAEDDAFFKNRSKRSAFVISPLKSILHFEVDWLSLQKLQYEMDCTDYPDYYNCFEIGYCGHPNFPYATIIFKKATNLILSHFRENAIYSFMIHSTTKKMQLVSLFIF